MTTTRRALLISSLAALGIGLYEPFFPSLTAEAAADREGIILDDDEHILVGYVRGDRTIFDLMRVDDDGEEHTVAARLFTIVEIKPETFRIEHAVNTAGEGANVFDGVSSLTFNSKSAAIHVVSAAAQEFIFV